ncbi:hypothetical protein LTR56_009498 [Elasticomyces elasticus]|nr:hypothetical protein LTR22_021486 [Elasticomyces elasticus]KAK3644833.1 hypothetical protein LTR56_009498 [Elasticomyces elasticus]KAK4930983.1 hypothetical protein LTR49_002398 [Elasticomyces elasticus]KAK5742544.1 hypothetical protein LTS12_024217 [Elasticomyces elasticus]
MAGQRAYHRALISIQNSLFEASGDFSSQCRHREFWYRCFVKESNQMKEDRQALVRGEHDGCDTARDEMLRPLQDARHAPQTPPHPASKVRRRARHTTASAATIKTTTDASSAASLLFSIPLEIREMIYDFVFAGNKVVMIPRNCARLDQTPPSPDPEKVEDTD